MVGGYKFEDCFCKVVEREFKEQRFFTPYFQKLESQYDARER